MSIKPALAAAAIPEKVKSRHDQLQRTHSASETHNASEVVYLYILPTVSPSGRYIVPRAHDSNKYAVCDQPQDSHEASETISPVSHHLSAAAAATVKALRAPRKVVKIAEGEDLHHVQQRWEHEGVLQEASPNVADLTVKHASNDERPDEKHGSGSDTHLEQHHTFIIFVSCGSGHGVEAPLEALIHDDRQH